MPRRTPTGRSARRLGVTTAAVCITPGGQITQGGQRKRTELDKVGPDKASSLIAAPLTPNLGLGVSTTDQPMRSTFSTG